MPPAIKKELLLINPKAGNILIRNIAALILKFELPLSLLTLAALTPKEYKVKILNLKTFWLKRDVPAGSLVGITCYSMNARMAYRLAERFKRWGAYVIMGGPHVTCLSDEALQHCDSVVIGEAESVWGEVLGDFEGNALKEKYFGEPLDDFFSPVYDYFFNRKPLGIMSTGIQTTRGCKYHCDFCALPFKKLRTINLEQVLALVKKAQPIARWLPLYFKDDNIYSDPAYAKELFKRLIPLKIKWFSFSSIDIVFDEEALRLASMSGCCNLTIGFESIYPSRLPKTSLNEQIKTSDDLLKAIRKIKSYGIGIRGAFILGFDYYKHADYFRLLFFLARARFYFIVLGILTPFPGSALYDKLQSQKRIIAANWDKFDCLHVAYKPQHTSAWLLQVWYVIIRIISFFLSAQTALASIALLVMAYLQIHYLVKYLFIR